MASPPTTAQFKQALFEERRALADLVDGLTPEQWACPSGCEGWSVGDVTAHLLVADRLTLDPLIGLLKLQPPIKSIHELQKRDAALGPKRLAERLCSNSLPLMFRFGGGFGSRINFAEHLLHGQDIRVPLRTQRLFDPPDALTWEAVRTIARFQRNKLPKGRLRLESPSGQTVVVERRVPLPKVGSNDGPADATVRGTGMDLLLFISGRQAEVAIEGDGPLADALRSEKITL